MSLFLWFIKSDLWIIKKQKQKKDIRLTWSMLHNLGHWFATPPSELMSSYGHGGIVFPYNHTGQIPISKSMKFFFCKPLKNSKFLGRLTETYHSHHSLESFEIFHEKFWSIFLKFRPLWHTDWHESRLERPEFKIHLEHVKIFTQFSWAWLWSAAFHHPALLENLGFKNFRMIFLWFSSL